MAIRAGQVVFTGGGTGDPAAYFVIDRIQSANINPNIPTEQINEVGNELAVAIVRDAPGELSLDIESYDMTAKLEALLLNLNPSTGLSGQALDYNTQQPFNVLVPMRSSQGVFSIVGGIIVPHTALQQVTYRFGLRQDAQQTFSLKGDSMYYGPPNTVPYEDTFSYTGSAGPFALTHTASPYLNVALNQTQYVLNVSAYNTDGTSTRLFDGTEFNYTDTSTSFTLTSNLPAALESGATLRAQYFSTTAETISSTVNTNDGISVKPAALRGWNINVYVGSIATTPVWTRLSGVQSMDLTWQAQGFDANNEFGNPNTVSLDYVVPAVNGTITTRPDGVTTMTSQLDQLLGISTSTDVIGMLSSSAVPLLIVLTVPNGVAGMTAGTPLKTLYIPDAIFDPPDFTARAAGKIELPFKFYSNTGVMYTYNGFANDLSFGYPTPGS